MKSAQAATLAFCALFAASLLAQGQMRPGLWEITMQMEMPGMPIKMPEMKVNNCVTPEQAKNPGATVPNDGGRGRGSSDCKATDQKVEGNKITWKMACTAPPMTGDGEMVLNGDSSYTAKTNMNSGGRAMTMQYTAKRVGDCTK